MSHISIPYDVYNGKNEIILVIPLGGVKKDSIHISIKKNSLYLKAQRIEPHFHDSFQRIQSNCYRGEITTKIELPPTVYFKDTTSTINKENILVITIPKNTDNEKVPILIE